MANIVQKQQQ